MYLKKELYELMRTDESIFDFIQNSSLDGLWYWDLENPENEWMNARFWTILGYNPDEMPHKSSAWQHIINQDDLKIATDNFLKHCENPTHPYDQLVRYTHKNGSIVWIRCRGLAIRNELGKPIRMLGAHQDVSHIKNSEQELLKAIASAKESEEKYRAMYNNAPLFYQSLDENGCFIDINPMWLKTLGYERSEVIGKWYGDFLHPDYVEHFRINFPAFKKRGYVSDVQFKLRRKDGTYIYVSFEGCIGYTPEGKFRQTYCVFKDITEQKALENALIRAKEKAEESEEKFRKSIEFSPIPMAVANINGDLLFLNNQFIETFGYTKEELVSIPKWFELVYPDMEYRNSLITQWNRDAEFAIKNNIPTPARECFVTCKNGDIKTIENTVFITNEISIGLFQDVSERKQAEEKILKQNDYIKMILDNFPIGIATNEIDSMKVTYMNRKFSEIYGWPEDDFPNIGDFFEKVFPDIEYRQHLQTKILADISSGDSERMNWDNLKITTKTGGQRIVYAHNIPLFSQNIMVSTVQDITERKHAELLIQEKSEEIAAQNEEMAAQNEELLQTNQELIDAKLKAEESDRLKSAFLANMSHEIRTPMNGILGFADLLKAPELSGEEQQAYIKIIEKSGARMLNIINDIIDISKIEAGLMKLDSKDSNINEQIEYIYTFFKPEAEAKKLKISFNNALPAKEAVVTTDREKLYAILTNLVKNAIKYTHNGSIEFGYNLKTDNETNELEFYVKDTGIGIPKERHEAIFERFIQADISDKMAYQGAGLGLAISKAYVEMLGGKIRVESEEGEGSCFYFTLPYKTEFVLENIDLELLPIATNEKIRKLKILIAEDDEVSEMLIFNLVKSFGKEILKVRTGVEAIEIYRNNPDIDLIMMDILMPVMGGYEATRKIREFNKTVVIIAQTAYALAGDKENAIASGCNDYISKPINKKELLALMQKYFGNKND
jgi:PAS domain S-box-containing protein